MRAIIGGMYYSTIEGSSVQITRSVSDPVPTCSLNLRDVNSSLNPQMLQEVVIIDDQQIPNPTINLLQNPSLNPYNTSWTPVGGTGITLAAIGGGGLQVTVSNATPETLGVGTNLITQTLTVGQIQPGQTYVFSCYVQGSSSPTNIGIQLAVIWQNQAGGDIGNPVRFTGPVPVSTSLTRYSLTVTAPAGVATCNLAINLYATGGANSGVIQITQTQFEPEWITTLSYPTPWCGPAQTNCQQLPLGYWIRQYRKFAGFVTNVVAQDYHGNVRTLVVNCSGYAWLMGTILANDTFTNKTDAFIIAALLNKYLLSSGTAMLTTTNVVAGITVSSLQSNWDDLRTNFDGLAGLSGFYWTIDAYWNFIYAPPGYVSMQIGLICDNSSPPNLTTTFPAYDFSAEQDFTQPGSTILVLGNGTNTAEVIDPAQTAQLGITSGYSLPAGTFMMRKVNDSALASTADCTTRGIAELLQYDYPRGIYHLTTNVELIPGQSIQITSATDGLTASTQLIQQTTATWIGTQETLTDFWKYVSDLGATNRAATNIMSRIFRATQSGTSAPAISVTSLAVIEKALSITDTIGTGTTVSNYAQSILPDTPLALYPLSEITGTIADDMSGNANQGTLSGGITLGGSGLLTDPADTGDTAMTFNGSSGTISLPTSLVVTGAAHAWSEEVWCNPAALPTSGNSMAMLAMGTNVASERAVLEIFNNSGAIHFVLSGFSADITSSTTPATSTTYHVVGTYDGTSTRLYVNGSLVAGPTAFALSLVATYANIGSINGANLFNGTIQYPAIYNFALSAGQVSAHYTAGT